MPSQVSAGAIVFKRAENGIKYLLLKGHYKTEYWDFPKGLVKKGEEIEKAALREVEEETGLKNVKFIPDFKEKISYFFRSPQGTVYKEVFLFLAEARDGEVKISWEHEGFEWVDFETAISRVRKNQAEIIKKANGVITKNL